MSTSPRGHHRYLRAEEEALLRDAYARAASVRQFAKIPAFLQECFGQPLTELELEGVLADCGCAVDQPMGVEEFLAVMDVMKARRAEGVRTHRYLRLREVEALKLAYDMSGGLQSFKGIRSFLQERFGQLLTDDELERVLAECGYEIGHCMSLDEFLRVMDVMKRRHVEETSQSTTQEAFGALADENAEGHEEVSMAYLRSMMSELGLSLAALEEADKDNSGYINFTEFDHLFDPDSSETSSDAVQSSEEEKSVLWQGRAIPIRARHEPAPRRRRSQRSDKPSRAVRTSSISERMNVILMKDDLKRQSCTDIRHRASRLASMDGARLAPLSAASIRNRSMRSQRVSHVVSGSSPTSPMSGHMKSSDSASALDFASVDSCGSDGSQCDTRAAVAGVRGRRSKKHSSLAVPRDSRGSVREVASRPGSAGEGGDTAHDARRGADTGSETESTASPFGTRQLRQLGSLGAGWPEDDSGGRWRGEVRPTSRRERQASRADFLDRVERSMLSRKRLDVLHAKQLEPQGRSWNSSVVVPAATPKQDREGLYISCLRPQSCPPTRTAPAGGMLLPAVASGRRPMTGSADKRRMVVATPAKKEAHRRWLQGCAFRGEKSKLKERLPVRCNMPAGEWTA